MQVLISVNYIKTTPAQWRSLHDTTCDFKLPPNGEVYTIQLVILIPAQWLSLIDTTLCDEVCK